MFICSGGRNLTISGTDLDAVDSIYIFVTFIDGSFSKNEVKVKFILEISVVAWTM